MMVSSADDSEKKKGRQILPLPPPLLLLLQGANHLYLLARHYVCMLFMYYVVCKGFMEGSAARVDC